MANITSRSGLIPVSESKITPIYKVKNDVESVRELLKFEAHAMPLSLRPFGGVFNPFARSCSVLCNHPVPQALKLTINDLKAPLACASKPQCHYKGGIGAVGHLKTTDHILDDIFQRYSTDTDSRPLTPVPTELSMQTRLPNAAASFRQHNRRCITPELRENSMKRKELILDLRKTHSQEILHWKTMASDVTDSGTEVSYIDRRSVGVKTAGNSVGGGGDDGVSTITAATVQGLGGDKMRKLGTKSPMDSEITGTVSDAKGDSGGGGGGSAKRKGSNYKKCINESDDMMEESGVIARHGKKRKNLSKPVQATTNFHLSADPETQVAALSSDSINPSTRASLILPSSNLLKKKDKSDGVSLKGSFLTDTAFQTLQIELDVDVIENTFERYLNRALREAIKFIPAKSKPKSISSVENKDNAEKTRNFERMPRKFSKSATRFDVPLNLSSLEGMTVLSYLSKFVWVSRQRKHLYKRTFLTFVNQSSETEGNSISGPADDLMTSQPESQAIDGHNVAAADDTMKPGIGQSVKYVERTMDMKALPKALDDVLEFRGKAETIERLLQLIDYKKYKATKLDFRSWCGVVSFAERLALENQRSEDSCDELEKSDFNSLEQHLRAYDVSEKLRSVLAVIQRTHDVKD